MKDLIWEFCYQGPVYDITTAYVKYVISYTKSHQLIRSPKEVVNPSGNIRAASTCSYES